MSTIHGALKKWGQKITTGSRRILGSEGFLYAIIGLVIVQALWYVFSFKLALFDEGQHFGFTQFYTHTLNPFISHQPQGWDQLGEIPRSPSYLFYYLMSWPLRIVTIFTSSIVIQGITLRLIMLGFFIAGLILYRRLFLRLGASRTLSNAMLLLFILLPLVAVFPGAYNYDNVIFFLFPLLLLNTLNVINSKHLNFTNITSIFIVGLLGCMMNVLFIGLFIPVLLYLSIYLYRLHRARLPRELGKAFRATNKALRIVLILLVIGLGLLFVERHVVNVVKYHNIDAPCTSVMSKQRCLKNYTAARNVQFHDTKPTDFHPINPFNYTLVMWLPSMVNTAGTISPVELLPLMGLYLYSILFFGTAIFLIYVRYFWQQKSDRVIIVISLGYVLVLWIQLYASYWKLGQPVAISSRYLLPVLPLFAFYVARACLLALSKRRSIAVLVFMFALLIATQGGSITTAALTADGFEQQNRVVHSANNALDSIFHKIVIEHNPL